MTAQIAITRAGPVTSIQDQGRAGWRGTGVAASGPMDAQGWARAGSDFATTSGIEFTMAGLSITNGDEPLAFAVGGGQFSLQVNGKGHDWPTIGELAPDDELDIGPGPTGNYGYIRFNREIDVPFVLGSRATNLTVGLGGFEGRALVAGDSLTLGPTVVSSSTEQAPGVIIEGNAPIRVMWGLHADLYPQSIRSGFITNTFTVSPKMDRMGVRLNQHNGLFENHGQRGLVSDAVVSGDIQILGDGTPIVLMRDHQPTGGYPRIATVISADLSRFAQMRPGTEITFQSVTLEQAHLARKGMNQ